VLVCTSTNRHHLRPTSYCRDTLNADKSRLGNVGCEEPLKDTLTDERVLQLPCQHLVHEQCLYGYLGKVDGSNHTCPSCDEPLDLNSLNLNVGMHNPCPDNLQSGDKKLTLGLST